MKYKGKESKTVWNPRCVLCSRDTTSSFYNEGLFETKESAMSLIKDWVRKATEFNPDAFKVIMDDECAVVISKYTNEKLYDFRMFPMALFA